jgi:PAS domain-containing protein
LHDRNGDVTLWFGSATDIHEQHSAREELESRMNERTRELQQAGELRRELLARVETLQDEERRRIARELHDTLGQLLSALLLSVAAVRARLQGEDPVLAEQFDKLQQLMQTVDHELDRIVFTLRPTALEDSGLGDAITAYVASWSELTGQPVDLLLTGLEGRRLPPRVEAAVFRVVQEALNNIAKHARASSIGVSIERLGRLLMVSIEDDGVGFDAELTETGDSSRPSRGLLGMRERIEALGVASPLSPSRAGARPCCCGCRCTDASSPHTGRLVHARMRNASATTRNREQLPVHLDFQLIFNAAPGCFVVLAPDGPRFTILAATDAYLRATRTRREDIVGCPLLNVLSDQPDESGKSGTSRLRASLQRAIERRSPDAVPVQRYDLPRPQALGGGCQERWWRILSTPVVDAGGKLRYLIQRVEEAAEDAVGETSAQNDSEQRLQAIFRLGTVGAVKLARDGHFPDVNARMCEMTGYSRKELLRMTAAQLAPRTMQRTRMPSCASTCAGKVPATMPRSATRARTARCCGSR